ncbi:CDP-alcohol phosphatidyltransferase family protein [Streptomyces albidocamelliae]|uniref:CDP-alcohol phosphatidyltransferase family protein n=1 Tax=Streptomyces albidocamelliae TaxID=2981135 RepID=A0ABY6EWQ3_9ACTN|nr:CDP-alcohol phosphatidyltransferase family protein [Streptomyces sp. HUAS 14-6]UXY38829.1 CDP-alcohol phosphatidyltransferase family protein [Streptomyces sp. HUAS 14-6]
MPTAIVTGQPVPGSSLESDLRSLGFDVQVAADASGAETLLAAAPAADRVAVVDARFVGHLHALRLGLTDPRFPLSAVPGAVTAQPGARQALTRAVARETSAGGGTALAVDSLADGIVTALDADGAEVHRPELGSLVAAVPDDPQARNEARQAVASVDDEAVRLKSAVKSRDGFFTTFFISPYSRYLARWCARRGLTPNQVTTASLLTALIAAGCAATGTRAGFVAAGVLLIASFVLDCTDGQLARYALKYSTLGAWLDATFDRAKEYAYYAGLALGAARGGDDVWALALGAMVLQTCRHVVDFSFNEANHDATANTSPTAALSDRLDSVGWTVWVRRMIVLPIGERWAMIAVLTAATTPRITFYVLLIGCAFAAAYTTAGRVLRSLTRKARRTDRAAQALADLADSGPLADALRRPLKRGLPGLAVPAVALLGGAVVVACSALTGRGSVLPVVGALVYVLTSALAVARPLKGALDWLVPPVFRAAEYGTVLALAGKAGVNGALPAAFGLVAAVAYHHYDTVYRIRGNAGAPPARLVRAIGGHEGRTLLVTVLAAVLTASQFKVALTVLAVAVALVVLVESIRFWVSAGAPAVHDEGEPA